MLRSLTKTLPTLHPTLSHKFATNEKAVKLRMKAVDSIRKITKAMKMVASSKMRMDMLRLNNGKEFGVGVIERAFQNDPYVSQCNKNEAPNTILMVPITTDRSSKQWSVRLN